MDAITTAAALFSALESKNPTMVSDLYADDVQVWHNFSNVAQNKSQNLEVLVGLCASVAEIHYDVIERLQLDDGRVLQRHNLRAITDSGDEIIIPACMLLQIQGGKIRRIDEYLDSGQANRLRALTGRRPIGS
jgi:ketosteroid isomerase-like protein